MQYRRLGRSGLMISELTLGTMNFGGPTDEITSLKLIDKALDYGINLLDCANTYAGGRSEKIIGKALKNNGKRHHVLLTSKAFMPTSDRPNTSGNSRHNLINSCMESLNRLHHCPYHGSCTSLPSLLLLSALAHPNTWMIWYQPRISTCYLKTWPGSIPWWPLEPMFPTISTRPDGAGLSRIRSIDPQIVSGFHTTVRPPDVPPHTRKWAQL